MLVVHYLLNVMNTLNSVLKDLCKQELEYMDWTGRGDMTEELYEMSQGIIGAHVEVTIYQKQANHNTASKSWIRVSVEPGGGYGGQSWNMDLDTEIDRSFKAEFYKAMLAAKEDEKQLVKDLG